MNEFVPASQLYDVDSRTPIAHPAHQATDEEVQRALEDREIRADGGQPLSGTDQSNRRKSVQPQGHFFPVPIGRNTPSGSSREAIGLSQFSQIATVVGRSCNNVISMGDKWGDFGLNQTRIQHVGSTHLLRSIFQRLHWTLQSGTDREDGGSR